MTTRGGSVGTLWMGMAVLLAGVALDVRWHLMHEEFEGVPQQFEAHWLLWLGTLTVLAVAALAVARSGSVRQEGVFSSFSGPPSPIRSSTSGISSSTPTGSDPAAAHVLLIIGLAAIIGGAILTTALAWRG